MKCMSQYLRMMSLKMRWPWIWATFGIQTIVASWTIIVVMHIIITLINCALIVDCFRTSKTMMTSMGEWRVGQTQHGAAKSMRNFVLSGAVMTVGIHFEYTIGASILVPIGLIYSEHVFAYITEVLRAAIGWSQQQTRHARSHGKKMILSIQMAYILHLLLLHQCNEAIQLHS